MLAPLAPLAPRRPAVGRGATLVGRRGAARWCAVLRQSASLEDVGWRVGAAAASPQAVRRWLQASLHRVNRALNIVGS